MTSEVNYLEVLEQTVGKKMPGPTPSFLEIHVIEALEIMKRLGFIGRKNLSKLIGLGEGMTRTLIRRLKDQGLIKIDRYGISLSDLGDRVLLSIALRISGSVTVPQSSITLGNHNCAILVRDSLKFLKKGVEQRDAAMKIGALGATTLIFKANKFQMVGVTDGSFIIDLSFQMLLLKKLRPQENDVIIIASANEATSARIGAKAAAFELLKEIDGSPGS